VRIGGEPVPELVEIFASFTDIRINIDPKTKEVVLPLAKLIRETDMIDKVCIGSFSYKHTAAVAAELGGQKKVCTAAGPLGFMAVKIGLGSYLHQLEAACLQLPLRKKDLKQQSDDVQSPNKLLTTERVVERSHNAGLDVHVWTVNDLASIQRAMSIGVNGIMSDHLGTLLSAVRNPA
jgi:glycerophosphoryl diester phosphodiesterase